VTRDIPEIERLEVAAYTIPTDFPEADGTLAWDRTTMVVVHLAAGGETGLGYSYTGKAAAGIVKEKLESIVLGADAFAVEGLWWEMWRSVRNLGHAGVCATAISAVDWALWDLKAKLLGLPLVTLLGQVRPSIDVYGSGGFTSYPLDRLAGQLGGWVAQGIPRVKMKVGSNPQEDEARVRRARAAIGPEAELMVDANGAYDRKQALAEGRIFAEQGVAWFEEPVSSDDLEGLRLLRDRAPAPIEVSAGEYGYDPIYFRRMIEAGAVDVLQADATRCLGLSGFLRVAALCDAFEIPLSGHTAPALHLAPGCAIARMRHLEWFHDHVRIEGMLLDGAQEPRNGMLAPDLSRPGLGLVLKKADADRFAA
jgi:L-alanine-DL-glutamate epimerase-like enolase superfamily enzyme